MPRYVSNSVWPYDMAHDVASFSIVLAAYAREEEEQRDPVVAPRLSHPGSFNGRMGTYEKYFDQTIYFAYFPFIRHKLIETVTNHYFPAPNIIITTIYIMLNILILYRATYAQFLL
jgi:hypothetical protein